MIREIMDRNIIREPDLLSEEYRDYVSGPGEETETVWNPKVADMEEDDRPYERAERNGVGTLSNADLLAVILRSGQPGYPVTRICRDLMRRFGGRFHALAQCQPEELTSFKGIGKVKAMQLRAIMEIVKRFGTEEAGRSPLVSDPDAAARLMMPVIGHESVEHIYLICLSQSHRLIKLAEISRGTATASIFDLKSAMRTLLLCNAQAVMLCHNHPSGNMVPSPQDTTITRELSEACRLMKIRFLDHIIVGGGTDLQPRYYSYHQEGRLP